MNQEEFRASIKVERERKVSPSSVDIVVRLRPRAGEYDEYDWHFIAREAADEIERLRKLLPEQAPA